MANKDGMYLELATEAEAGRGLGWETVTVWLRLGEVGAVTGWLELGSETVTVWLRWGEVGGEAAAGGECSLITVVGEELDGGAAARQRKKVITLSGDKSGSLLDDKWEM